MVTINKWPSVSTLLYWAMPDSSRGTVAPGRTARGARRAGCAGPRYPDDGSKEGGCKRGGGLSCRCPCMRECRPATVSAAPRIENRTQEESTVNNRKQRVNY